MLAFFWPEGMGGLTYAEREFDVTKEQGTMDLIFETQDGFITAGAVSGKEWVGMCQALNRAELIEDERFATSSARMENADLRKQIVADEVKHWHSAEILKRLDDNDVPSAPLLSRMELMSHEQINANKSIERTVYEGFGEVRQAVPAARFDVTPSMINGPAPKLGEHSREVLLELGYHQRKCDELLKSEVVIAD
jgi:crotonobetainyl-CoA:carnitine CoA-transferase CaiB-like acyl-CoA transferase